MQQLSQTADSTHQTANLQGAKVASQNVINKPHTTVLKR